MNLITTIIAQNEDLKLSITIGFEAAKYSLAPQEADVLWGNTGTACVLQRHGKESAVQTVL